MVTLRLTREECQILLSWTDAGKEAEAQAGLKWEPDEVALASKVRTAWEKSYAKSWKGKLNEQARIRDQQDKVL